MEFQNQVLTIEGMHCDACVRRVSHALGAIPGVRVNAVEVGRARVLAQAQCEDRIREALAADGFTLTALHAAN